MPTLNRRSFLGMAAGTYAASALAPAPAMADGPQYQVEDQTPFRGQTRRLKLTNGSRCITSLIFSTDYPTHFRLKPELYPVCTPAGLPVTDSHQFSFIHHQSIMTGHGKVRFEGTDRDIDFYRQLPYPDGQRDDPYHTGHNLFQMGPSGIQKITHATWSTSPHIRLDLRLEWQSREQTSAGGKALILEQRRFEIRQQGPHTIIDQFSKLVPTEASFTMHADRHSFVGIRVHDLIDPDEGGQMRDSLGRINPDGNYWDAAGERQAPRWIDCTGNMGAQRVGVTLFSHPSNVRNEFYCRSWGLMICSATLGHDVLVTEKQPFQFAARYVAHDGELSAKAAKELYEEFAAVAFPADLHPQK